MKRIVVLGSTNTDMVIAGKKIPVPDEYWSKGPLYPPVRRYLNAKGMAVVTLKYRTRGGNDPDVRIADEFAFDEKSCPVLFLHGDADPYSAMGSVLVWNRLRAMGVPSAVHTFALRGHDFQYAAAPGTSSYNYLDIVWNYMNQVGFVKADELEKGCHDGNEKSD